MTRSDAAPSAAHGQVAGRVFRWALAYDLLLKLLWRGSEHRYREKTVSLAGIRPGDTVLDVGCGTGTLAIAAKRCAGSAGQVYGLDASHEMRLRACKKAAAAGTEIDVRLGSADAIPFPEETFDVVLSTTVLHCLADHARLLCIREMVRVLKPSGRLLLVDFGGPKRERLSLIGHLSAHRNFDVLEFVPIVYDYGLSDLETGSLGFSDLQFVLAMKPSGGRAPNA